MNKQDKVLSTEKRKVVTITVLYIATIIIMFLGLSFTIFSAVNKVTFKVLNSDMPGAIFGMLVLYLGVRYFLSVKKLKAEVYKNTSQFDWSNFKKEKNKKVMS